MTSIRRIAGLAVVAATALALAGCAIPAFFAAQFGPEEDIPAEFEMPKGKTVLVLVEYPDNRTDYEPIKAHLTGMINEQLTAHKVASRTVPFSEVGKLRDRDPAFYETMAVGPIGARLGADLVVYVLIDEFALRDPDASEELWKGRLQTIVRVVDISEGRLWPKDVRDGHVVDPAETPTISDSDSANNPALREEAISKELAAVTADRIAKLFYAHSRPYEGAYGDDPRRTSH